MQDYSDLLTKQLKEINDLLKKSERNLRKMKDLPDTRVYTADCRGNYQYYTYSEGKKKYVKKEDRKKIVNLIQRDYERSVNSKLKLLKKKLEAFLKSYNIDAIESEYRDASEGLKKHIIPITKTTEDRIAEWYDTVQGSQNYYYDEGDFKTNNGEMVRSKSEKIIADTLYRNNIPYKCEPRVILADGSDYYPDFIIYNVRKDKTLYWEHFGLISDPGYAVKNFKKLRLYDDADFRLGDNLIISMEWDELPIDITKLEEKIQRYCT
ncbi:hypothetical protein [Butyrivibrio proteoclasticus]|uniref:hypothetical protein n=1 Tax=Butyrivibrio proteoclasticus TaxID=43305 RepID=UPI0006883734|nr:hypothetical protein [Butyrivibrio proteoclasticus]